MGEPVVVVNGLDEQLVDDDNPNRNKNSDSWDTNTIFSCTTFNILAPIYKRLGGGARESQFRESWHSRNCRILDRLLLLKSSVICLQEFWVDNEELAGMYESRLHTEGYLTYKLARTNSRGDVEDGGHSRNEIHPLESPRLVIGLKISSLFLKQLRPFYPILLPETTNNMPIAVAASSSGNFWDWNGSKKGHVYKFLRSQGFVSTYDVAHYHEDDTDDSQKWVSHRNHRGNICGVDFIWLQNPQIYQKPLKESFMEAILGNIKNLLHKVITGGVDQLPLRLRGSCITYSDFSQALVELGISGNPDGGLNDEDIRDIWKRIDEDGDGIVHVPNILGAWTLCALQHDDSSGVEDVEDAKDYAAAVGFTVNKATLFPQEVEEGTWPENYFLSDHAHLTVEFAVM
uniref:EF-hand domain-containing protein n=1 Tax=Chenopodium quinoa TaxID=63459 RepID=A0A803LXP9_CHEQI